MAGSCDLASQLSQARPHLKIVALAASYDEGNIMQCAEAGVTCYVPREASINDLVEAMREAVKGAVTVRQKLRRAFYIRYKVLRFRQETSTCRLSLAICDH